MKTDLDTMTSRVVQLNLNEKPIQISNVHLDYSGQHIFFLNADVVLYNNFESTNIEDIDKRNMNCMDTYKFDTEDGKEAFDAVFGRSNGEVYHYLYLYNQKLKAEEFKDKNGEIKSAVVADLKKLSNNKTLMITDIKIVKQKHNDRSSVIIFIATTTKLYQFRGLDSMSVLSAFND